jgi:hypothetical protein
MGSNFCRHRRVRELFMRKPGFLTYYTIGAIYAKRLPPAMGLKEISLSLGMSTQKVSICSHVALGKLIYGLVHSVGETPEL